MGFHSAILSALIYDSKFNCIPHGLSQDSTNSLMQATAYFSKNNTEQQGSSTGYLVVNVKTAQIHRYR